MNFDFSKYNVLCATGASPYLLGAAKWLSEKLGCSADNQGKQITVTTSKCVVGWAVNADAKISIPFGETLTDSAKFPLLKLKDPYKKKGMSASAKVLYTLLAIAIVAAAACLVLYLKDSVVFVDIFKF